MEKSKHDKISKLLYKTKIIHQKNIPLFESFISLLKKNSIDYFLTGGTLLGCIRHNMTIPWDDDYDIFIFSSDINKVLNFILHVVTNWQFVVKYHKNNICDIFTEKCNWWTKVQKGKDLPPLPKYPIIQKKFHGKNYNVSSNFHDELVFWYGNDYMTKYVFKADHDLYSKNYIITNDDIQEIHNIYNNIKITKISMIF